jgi:hypothetical protein
VQLKVIRLEDTIKLIICRHFFLLLDKMASSKFIISGISLSKGGLISATNSGKPTRSQSFGAALLRLEIME